MEALFISLYKRVLKKKKKRELSEQQHPLLATHCLEEVDDVKITMNCSDS